MGYSNLAYKNWVEEEEIGVAEAKVQPQKKSVKNFRPIIYVLILSVAAYYMISKSVVLYETKQEIKQKQAELTELETYTSQRTFELEQSVDLATVEEIATTKLNMQRPESYQIEYVSMNRDDVTEVTAGEVEGVKSKVNKAAESFKRNIVGIFTIRGK
ncbi:MAG: cell division protein FtsL [Clostridia bacterium]|nr:cell division protein FtsL [Clostridia bacterium]